MITDYLDGSLGEGNYHKTEKGDQYSYQCPFCKDHRDRMFVNVNRKVYFCHNCDATGTLISLIADYTQISYKEALDIFREYDGYEQELPDDLEEEIYKRLYKAPEIEIVKTIHPLPDEFVPIEEARGKLGKEVVKYIRSRGLTLSMAERYSMGYCDGGQYDRRIIMPDFEDYELIYWQARTIDPAPKIKLLKKHYRKVMNPSLTEEQIDQGMMAVSKSEIVSNIDLILDNGVAVICEGKMDAYTIGDSGAAIHGKVMSDTQFMKLVMNKDKIDVIYIMLDGDAFEYAIRIAKRLYKHFDDVYVCRMPHKEADPNGIGARGCLEVIEGAMKYSPLFEVKCRIRGWL